MTPTGVEKVTEKTENCPKWKIQKTLKFFMQLISWLISSILGGVWISSQIDILLCAFPSANTDRIKGKITVIITAKKGIETRNNWNPNILNTFDTPSWVQVVHNLLVLWILWVGLMHYCIVVHNFPYKPHFKGEDWWNLIGKYFSNTEMKRRQTWK